MSKHTFKAWVLATRPWSFPASTMPVLVTLCYLFWKGHDVNWLTGVWALVNIVVFHAAGNTWSDYNDFQKGVDREDTIGGLSITSGEFKAAEIRTLALILLAVAVVMGVALVFITGVPTLYVGIAGALLTLLYPQLKFNALGDVDIFLTYSLLPILGTSFVATGEFHLDALWLSLPIGLITVGILHSNNMRDTEQDKRANIKTFAMLVGKKVSLNLYYLEIILPFIWVAVCSALGMFPLWSLLALIAVKPAIDILKQASQFIHKGAKALYGVDEATAKLQLVFSLLTALSFVIARFV